MVLALENSTVHYFVRESYGTKKDCVLKHSLMQPVARILGQLMMRYYYFFFYIYIHPRIFSH